MKTILVISGLIFLLGSTRADPTECYYCLGTAECDDPVDVSKIATMKCSDIADMIPGLPISQKEQVKQLMGPNILNSFANLTDTDNTPVACYKVTAKQSGNKGTVRGCFYKTFLTQDGCDLVNSISDGLSDVKCSTCGSNLCNSSNNVHVHISLVALLSLLMPLFKYICQ